MIDGNKEYPNDDSKSKFVNKHNPKNNTMLAIAPPTSNTQKSNLGVGYKP